MPGSICQRFLLTVIIFLSVYFAKSQSKIEGLVTGANSQPLAGATVLLLKSSDSALIKGLVTSTIGHYLFEKIPAGSYFISVSNTGYEVGFSQVITVSENENKQITTITLTEKNSSLKEVTVVTRKPLYEMKIDRMVINVANNITAAGTTALDVLERSPGIIVDRNNNAISINGKDGVVVMINGQKNYMPLSAVVQMLAGMPSDNIERLEIITTPPANFDAEGNAGYINIVLKKNSQIGTNGTLTLDVGYSKGLLTTATGNFNHREKRWNLYGNYSFDREVKDQILRAYHGSMHGGNFYENYSNSYR